MKRILLTGLSGTGKSTIIAELGTRGYKAVDADCDLFSQWVAVDDDLAEAAGSPVDPKRDWVWREDKIQNLLLDENADVLFLSGCAANMGKFLPQFNCVILLTAPVQIMKERLRTRTNNPYGKRLGEMERMLEMKETVEPLLRRISHYEIDTSICLDAVLTTLLQLAA